MLALKPIAHKRSSKFYLNGDFSVTHYFAALGRLLQTVIAYVVLELFLKRYFFNVGKVEVGRFLSERGCRETKCNQCASSGFMTGD